MKRLLTALITVGLLTGAPSFAADAVKAPAKVSAPAKAKEVVKPKAVKPKAKPVAKETKK